MKLKIYFFCHAGIRPSVALHAQSEENVLRIRADFHAHLTLHPKMIVDGHSPVDKACHYGNRINLDSGAGYGHPLTAAVFEAGTCYVLTPWGAQRIF